VIAWYQLSYIFGKVSCVTILLVERMILRIRRNR
jgi:hypothetical protein